MTDKFLAGLPGIQKEAGWPDHQRALGGAPHASHTRTVCLEFFGNAKDAVPSIVEIKDFMFAEAKSAGRRGAGRLEHLDDRYLKAVGYATKSKPRRGGNSCPRWCCSATSSATTRRRGARHQRGGAHRQFAQRRGLCRHQPEARKKFWLDRKRTAAISRHTNAFKINEDVVIPLPRMAGVHRRHQRINIELSLRNKMQLADELEGFFATGNLPLGKSDDASGDCPAPSCWKTAWPRPWPGAPRCAPCGRTGWPRWTTVPRNCRTTACAPAGRRRSAPRCSPDLHHAAPLRLSERVQRHPPARVLKGRVWVALHMHAGDGNVHTNIPVNSDDYEMLQTAHGAWAHHGAGAQRLDGVISASTASASPKSSSSATLSWRAVRRLQGQGRPAGRFNEIRSKQTSWRCFRKPADATRACRSWGRFRT